jgi:hypothetical protein
MKRLLFLAIAATVLVAGVAVASPGDSVTVRGTVLNRSSDLIVIKGDNGSIYYVDARRASGSRQFAPGTAINVAGHEGSRKDEILATVVDASGTSTGLAQGGLNLPSDHRYEQYNPESSAYVGVTVDRVPALVQKGVPVYDRTANAWVYSPEGSMDQRYLGNTASSGPAPRWDRLGGTVERVSGSHVTVRTDDNRTVDVDISQARVRTGDSLQRGDRVTVFGTAEGGNRFTARGISDERTRQAAQSQFQRIHGQVQSKSGSTLQLKADDGRLVSVDMSRVGTNTRSVLDPGEGATILGFASANPNQFRAEYIQQDSNDIARRGTVAGPSQTTLPGRGQPVTLEGQASSFEGRTVRFTTNTGMKVMIDTSKVDDEQHRILVSNAPVKIAGVRGEGDTIIARQITRDDARGRAAPGSMADEQKATTVHGKVVSVSGDELKMRTDDGRNLRLDITAVREENVRKLKPGDAFTASGFYRGDDRSQFSVRSLREDAPGTASPRTTDTPHPMSVDDCKQGWSRYKNPGFMNLADCTNYVNQNKR